MDSHSESTASTQLQMRKFNPGLLQTDEEVAAQFVVRDNEFQTVCEVVRGNIESPSCQHVLVVGSRGQGKSMLLRRVTAELRMDSDLSKHFLPVQFMEENREIDCIADFWMETLFHLARALAASDADLSNELSATHRSLVSRWREQGFAELARAAVLDASDRLGRGLVLMIENVQSLFAEADDDFGWELRAVLQTMPQITLVASATNRFEALDDPQAPFFELFRFVNLKPLNTAECGRLWSLVSEVETSISEIRPLEILTGGNPRLIVVVATFAQHRSLRQLMEELVILVDEHTDYFRSHLDVLPPKERRVFVALIDLWQPSSTSDIATRARLDVRIVSTMLKRLIDRGAVMIVEGDGARNRRYVASERLFSIYYKLRREYDERAVVESLIHFMVSFYDVREISMMSEQLFADALESSTIQAGITSALTKRGTLGGADLELKWDEIARTSQKVTDERKEQKLHLLHDEAVKAIQGKNWQELLAFTDRYTAEGFLKSGSQEARDASVVIVAQAKSDAHFGLGEYGQVIRAGEEADESFYDVGNLLLIHGFCHLKINQVRAQLALADFEGANRECFKILERLSSFDEPFVLVYVVLAHVLQSQAKIELGEFGNAIALLDEVLQRYGEHDDELLKEPVSLTLFHKAELLAGRRGDFRGSAKCIEEYIRRCERDENESNRSLVIAATMKQAINCGMLGDFDQEITHLETVIHSVKENDNLANRAFCFDAWMYRSRRLAELGRSDEALASCDQTELWVERNPDIPTEKKDIGLGWYTNCTRALALTYRGQTDAAVAMLRAAFSAFDWARNSDFAQLMRLIPELLAAGAREEDLLAILQSDEQRAWNLLPLIVTLRQRIGTPVTVPIQALEIAKDLHACMNHRLVHGLQPGYGLRLADT